MMSFGPQDPGFNDPLPGDGRTLGAFSALSIEQLQ
eukprot:SAG11_NODE_11267_length_772_cov_1.065379_2_plen_34_part_01